MRDGQEGITLFSHINVTFLLNRWTINFTISPIIKENLFENYGKRIIFALFDTHPPY